MKSPNRPMFFKYRAIEPWPYLLDILVNSRLYAAPFTSLNDPMEGVFTYSHDGVSPSFIEQMVRSKAQLRICSMSRTHNNSVMWSYYSAAHSGISLGFTLSPSRDQSVDFEPISYTDDFEFTGFLGSDPNKEARRVLTKKSSIWKHEQETRVFSSEDFVPIKLERIYIGCKTHIDTKALLSKLVRILQPTVIVETLTENDLDTLLF